MIAPVTKGPTRRRPLKALRLLKVASRPGGIEKILAVRRGMGYEPARSDPIATAGRKAHERMGGGRLPSSVVERLRKLPQDAAQLKAERARWDAALKKRNATVERRTALIRDYGDLYADTIKRVFSRFGIYDPGSIRWEGDRVFFPKSVSKKPIGRIDGIRGDIQALREILEKDGRYTKSDREALLHKLGFLVTAGGTFHDNLDHMANLVGDYSGMRGVLAGDPKYEVVHGQKRSIQRLTTNIERLDKAIARLPTDRRFNGDELLYLYESTHGPIRPVENVRHERRVA